MCFSCGHIWFSNYFVKKKFQRELFFEPSIKIILVKLGIFKTAKEIYLFISKYLNRFNPEGSNQFQLVSKIWLFKGSLTSKPFIFLKKFLSTEKDGMQMHLWPWQIIMRHTTLDVGLLKYRTLVNCSKDSNGDAKNVVFIWCKTPRYTTFLHVFMYETVLKSV